jgi:hypothetical protein
MNENENIRYQYFQNAAKAVFRGNCIVANSYIKRKNSTK